MQWKYRIWSRISPSFYKQFKLVVGRLFCFFNLKVLPPFLAEVHMQKIIFLWEGLVLTFSPVVWESPQSCKDWRPKSGNGAEAEMRPGGIQECFSCQGLSLPPQNAAFCLCMLFVFISVFYKQEFFSTVLTRKGCGWRWEVNGHSRVLCSSWLFFSLLSVQTRFQISCGLAEITLLVRVYSLICRADSAGWVNTYCS